MTDVELQRSSQVYFKQRKGEEYPTRRGEKIVPGEIYRARNGERVRVYAIEGKQVHGAIYHQDTWVVDMWKIDGMYLKSKNETHPRDIILAPPLVIKAGTMYKSRDGRPVKVYEVNRGSIDFPVLGAIKDYHSDTWLPRIWNESGTTKIPYGPNNDIVVEWSET